MVYSTDKGFNDAILENGAKFNQKGYIIRRASPRSATNFLDAMESMQ